MFQVEKLVSDPIVMFLDNKICLNYLTISDVVFWSDETRKLYSKSDILDGLSSIFYRD